MNFTFKHKILLASTLCDFNPPFQPLFLAARARIAVAFAGLYFGKKRARTGLLKAGKGSPPPVRGFLLFWRNKSAAACGPAWCYRILIAGCWLLYGLL